VCRKRKQDLASKNVNEVTHFNTNDLDCSLPRHDNDMYVYTVEHDSTTNQAFAKVKVCSTELNMNIDTRAQVNVLPRSIFTLGKLGPVLPTQKKLTVYNGQPLKVDGCINLPCTYKGQVSPEEFYIVDTHSSPILGLQIQIQDIYIAQKCIKYSIALYII
jgi:hypothetical protein